MNSARASHNKQSLYFPDDMLREVAAEAIRQDRSMSWIIQKAWLLARERIKDIPSPDEQLSGVA